MYSVNQVIKMHQVNKYRIQQSPAALLLLLLLLSCNHGYSQKSDPAFVAGTALMMNQDYVRAAESFSLLLASHPDNTDNLLARAHVLFLAGKYQDALKDMLEADRLKPGICNYELAQTYALAGDKGKAILYLRKNLKSQDRKPESTIKLDKAFTSLDGTKEWKDIWLSDWYNRNELTEAEVQYMLSSGENLDAISRLNELIDKKSKKFIWFALRAKAYQNLNEPKNALEDLNEAISLNKRNPELYLRRATVLSSLGKWSKAANDYTQALKINPAQPDLYKSRAVAFVKDEKFPEALGDASLYSGFFRSDPEGYYLSAEAEYGLGQYTKAIQKMDSAILLDKANAQYFYLRGISKLEILNYKESIGDLAQALDLKPDFAEAWYRKGMARLYSGDSQGACMDLTHAGQLGNKEAYNRASEICGH